MWVDLLVSISQATGTPVPGEGGDEWGREGEEVGRTKRERRARGPRPRVHGRRHGRGGDEEGGERSGEGEALT